jgi:hypothetical protein
MCPYYLDGDLRWSASERRPTGDTRQSDPMSWVQLLMQPREESVRGCVATVRFSRAVREGVRVGGVWGPRRAAPVSQNSTACGALELDGMPSWHVQVRSTFQADRA